MGNVYASADWHGCGDPARKIIEYLKPDDTLYFLGDVIDRGPNGIELLDWLLSDPRVKMIKGNHEYFMEACAPHLLTDEYPISSLAEDWLQGNGGECTWDYLINNKSDEKIISYVEKIKNLPLKLEYVSPFGHVVIMEHSGFSPFDIPHRSHNPLWDREHFYDKWNSNYEIDQFYPYTPNDVYLVHGHTPVQYLKFMYGYIDMPHKTKEEITNYRNWLINEASLTMNIIRYCEGHKFDIDMCTIDTKRIALLNLDTFEEIYFDKDNNE